MECHIRVQSAQRESAQTTVCLSTRSDSTCNWRLVSHCYKRRVVARNQR